MEIGTWLSVLILGPGSLAIFAWFLGDLKEIMATQKSRRRGKRR